MKSRLLGAVSALAICIALSTPVQAVSYRIIDLGSLGGTLANANGINASGQVTGGSQIGDGSEHAFLYDGGTMQDIDTSGVTNSSSRGYGINDSGHVAGSATFPGASSGHGHAFLYDGSEMQDLGTLGGLNSYGRDINDSGQVTGTSGITGNNALHAFLYDGSEKQDHGTLGGTSSQGGAINSNGWVTGGSDIGGGISRAFLYDGSEMHDLGTLPGGKSSGGNGINDSGWVVGASRDADGQSHAFLHDGSSMQALCELVDCISAGWDALSNATDINDNGDIVGWGFRDGEESHHRAFLFTSTIPIPPAVWLFASGLIGLVVMARRKTA